MRKLQSFRLVVVVVFLVFAAGDPGRAQPVTLGKEAYLMPPKEIADAVLAPRHENVTLTNLSPDGKKFFITKSDGLPPLERLACPCVHLGEAAFDPTAYRERDLWVRSAVGFDLFFYADKRTVPVQVPGRARVSNPVWSPDGSRLAFFAHFPDATHIYIADTETGFSRRLTTTPVLATLVTSFQWSKDGKQIQTVLLPDDGKREMPKPSAVATEPKVRVARGGPQPSRTFRYLLESPHDMALLEHLSTGQLALIDVSDSHVTKIGFPNLFRSVSMAPGKEQFRITTMTKPFSYFVPMTRFGSFEGIWNQEGKSLFTLADRKLRDTEPLPAAATTIAKGGKGGGKGGKGLAPAQQPPQVTDPNPDNPMQPAEATDPEGKRAIVWRPDGVGLSFLQLEPAQPKDAKDARKDRVMQWLPPFGKDDVKVVYETPDSIASAQYSEDCHWLFLTQTVGGQRQVGAVELGDPNKPVYVISKGGAAPKGGKGAKGQKASDDDFDDDQSADAEQQAPKGKGKGGGGLASNLLTRASGGAVSVVRLSVEGEVYLSGSTPGAAKTPAKPFIDKVHIKSAKKTRVFDGQSDMLETVDAVDGSGGDIRLVFTTRQKENVVPDSYVTELATGKVTKLTNNTDHSPWYHELQVQRYQVTRVDGFKFWVKVTTPPKADGKLPALFWIYPKEYANQTVYNASAGNQAANTNRFAAPAPRSMTLLTRLGYAVVEPDVPIVGPPGRMNDNYIPDLRNSLWAVIDDLDKKGIIDRDRLALGGHSYGAFSTANAMAHTPFFKAGIAGDGNYNRTLTSMSFQTEKRQLWEARELYLEMSPLLWANRVSGALLMYHGMEDANVGTNPINAQHMFMALDGLGKPAALYMYPYEGHGPLARETTLDLWARWVAWLDGYVKNRRRRKW